ncbi:MAG: hypothetical protein ABEN55_06215 [Bradymonadaceae bacterium]
MADTDFVDGVTTVTADFLFGTDGHIHDGQDLDGHAPMIELERDAKFGDQLGYFSASGNSSLAEATLVHASSSGKTKWAANILEAIDKWLLGANGKFTPTTDGAGKHEVTHEHTGSGDSQWVTDILKATIRTASDILAPVSGALIDVRGAGALGTRGSGGVILSVLEAEGPNATVVVQKPGTSVDGDGGMTLAKLLQDENNNLIEVLNHSGAASGDEGFVLGRVRAIQDKPVQLEDSNGNLEILDAQNSSIAEFKLYWNRSQWQVDGRHATGVVVTDKSGYPQIEVSLGSSYFIGEVQVTQNGPSTPSSNVPYNVTAYGDNTTDEVKVILHEWTGSGWTIIGNGSTSNGSAPTVSNVNFHVTVFAYSY